MIYQLKSGSSADMPKAQRHYRKMFKWHPAIVKTETNEGANRNTYNAFIWPGFHERRFSGYHNFYVYRSRQDFGKLAQFANATIAAVGLAFWMSLYWNAFKIIALTAIMLSGVK